MPIVAGPKAPDTIPTMTAGMHFTANSRALDDAMVSLKQLIPQSPEIPSYGAVALEVSGTVLEMTASDGNNSMTITLPVSSGSDGKVQIPPRPLANLLSNVASGEHDVPVTLAVKESGDITVQAQGLEPYTFRSVPGGFPRPETPADFKENNDFKRLAEAVALCRKATSRDKAAIQIVSDEGSFKMNATDGFRLASVEIPGATFGDFTGVLSVGACERAAKLKPHRIAFEPKTRSVVFANENTVYYSRLMAAPFPAVEVILGSAPAPCTSVRRENLLSAVNRLSSTGDVLLLTFEGSTLTMTSGSTEVGEGKEVVDLVKAVPATFRAQLKAAYVKDALTPFSGDIVDVAYSLEKKPIFLTCAEPLPTVHVIMTIQTY